MELDLLIDRVPTLRVLLIVTYRPEFTPPWVGRPHVTVLSRGRLSIRHRTEMIMQVTGGKALPKEINDQIVDRTDGIPLFIEELTKTVVESGMLSEAPGRYAMTGPVPPVAIPTSLHASLLARLDRLAPTRELAQIGAALGWQFSHELISAVAPMPQNQVDDALEQLVRAELIFRRGTPPDAEYTFKHALVQEAAYGTLLRSRRQQLHARIVPTLESRFPEIVTAHPALVAYHCAEAGLMHKAIGYRLKAGQQATTRSAMVEAEVQFRKGLDHLAVLPDGPERQQLELDLQTALGMTVIATQGHAAPAVANAFARARQLCEQLDRPSQLALLLVGECQYHLLGGELALACQESKAILALGEARNNVDVKFQGCVISAITWFHVGDFVATRAFAEQALRLYDPAHPSISWWPYDPQVLAFIFLARSLAYLGYLDQARLCLDEARAIARQRQHTHSLVMADGISCEITDLAQCYSSVLLQRADELAALCAEHAIPYWAALAQLWRGATLSALGHAKEPATLITEALANFRATGAVTVIPMFLTLLAEVLGKENQAAQGLYQLDEAERQIERTEDTFAEARMHCVRGELLLVIGDAVAAEKSLRRAIKIAHRQSAKLYELRAATSLARLWRDHGKLTEGRDLLAPIYGWFTEGFDTPVLQDAKALLDELA
jgi:predicted ATPase